MSDVSQGPGWWIASDGKWYAPEEHPDRRSPTAPEPVASSGFAPPLVASPASTSTTTLPSEKKRRSPKLWVGLGAVVLLALAAAALVVALTSDSSTGSTLPTGAERATITVTVPRTGQPTFSGTFAGRTLTGTAISNATATPITGGPLVEYKGMFGGEPYVLHVSLPKSKAGAGLLNSPFSFVVIGTYGSEPVTATAQFGFGSSTSESLTVPIEGRVGPQPISGTATVSGAGGGTFQITATMSVLPSSI